MAKFILDNDGNDMEKRKWKRWKIKEKKEKKEMKGNTEATPLITPPVVSVVVESNGDQDSTVDGLQLDKARKLLYISHMVAKFAEIGWQFCVILFLTAIANYDSIILVSTYGLFCGLMSCLLGSTFGAFIDSKQYDRLYIAKFFILFENLSVVMASISCFLLLREFNPSADDHLINGNQSTEMSYFSNLFREVVPPLNSKTWSLLAAIHIFGGIARLLDEGFTVCIERDWIVVMSKSQDAKVGDDEIHRAESGSGTDENQNTISVLTGVATVGSGIDNQIVRDLKEKEWLAQTNTALHQIDLTSKILAPAVAGFFISWCDSRNRSSNGGRGSFLAYAALIVGLLNILSLFIEYSCTKEIYELIPALSDRGADNSAKEAGKMQKINHDESMGHDDTDGITIKGCTMFRLPRGLAVYFGQPISIAGLALAMLYLNVLSFGAIMTAYLISKGMRFHTIGFWRGMSSFIGLSGTVAFHVSERNVGFFATGMWSIIMQLTCLSLCFLSLFLPNLKFSLFLLIFGTCLSRIGLRSFDLAVTQLMQQHIPEEIRGTVGGVQNSLNSFFELATYALGFIFPNTGDFYILVTTGFISVLLAMCLYVFGVYKRQNRFNVL